MRMISPSRGTGSITTEPGWRTISMSTVWPDGSRTRSTSSLKMRPSYTVDRDSSVPVFSVIVLVLSALPLQHLQQLRLHRLQCFAQLCRQWCFELHAFAGTRVCEHE